MPDTHAIVLRIRDPIDRRTSTYDEASRCRITAIVKVVPDRRSTLECGRMSHPEQRLLGALHHRDLAFENINHLVLGTVPMLD